LRPKTRADKGQVRALTPEQQKWILEQAQAHLGVPVKVLYRPWKEHDPDVASLNTVYRLLREHDLSTKTRRQLLKQPLGGATKCFEAPFVNDLWMTDFSPGPFLHLAGQAKALSTQWCVLIDDHSRLIPYAAYFPHADTRAFHQTLKEAIRRRGLPAKLYTDRGGPFINDHNALDPHLDLDQLFYPQVHRTVRRDGAIRIDNHLYEVDLSLRSLQVQLRFDPFKLDRIEVYYRGASFGLAKGVNRPALGPAAQNLLISASGGLARSLCLLARAAWIEAASAGPRTIEPEQVQTAIERVPAAAGLALPPPPTTS
jgi:Mu transposase, C-terminal